MTGVFRIPEKKVRIDPDGLEAVSVGATEQPVNRPKRGQRRSYSGKKRHTVKHQVVVARTRKAPGEKQQMRIKAASKAAKGRVHDKKVRDRERSRIPNGVPKSGGSRYQGSDPQLPERKPRGGG